MSEEIGKLIGDVREQVLYLKELGGGSLAVELPERTASLNSVNSEKLIVESSSAPRIESQPRRTGSRLSALPSLGKRSKTESENMTQNTPVKAASEEIPLIEIAPKLEETTDTIESIRAEIGDCTRCKLHTFGRKQIVHTTGNFQADLMFIGEAPGADEDEQGFPFVGRAGQLLT
ncbi:MAG: uracil-DNA glycosylase family protein, partial [Pyrinomonadaceae bacterium]